MSLASCDFITRIWTRACGPTEDFDSRWRFNSRREVDGRHSFEGVIRIEGKCYPPGGRRALAQARRRRHPSQAIFSEHAPQHIWQKRFYDFNVWTERKRIEKLRYMHRNPVKRSLVASPELWRWSSFRAYFLGETGPVRLNEWEVLKMKTPHSGRVRAESQTAGCPASHFSKSARRGAPPTLYFAVKVAHPPPGQEPNEPV